MTHAEPGKRAHIISLRHRIGRSNKVEMLRVVLAIALDPDTAAWCAGYDMQSPVALWPSTLYRIVARQAHESPPVWRRCALVLDRTLHEAMLPYANHSAAELSEVFSEGRESLTGDELAALLWCLIRRRSPSDDFVADRLTREVELVAVKRLRREATS